jgi:hypothetical protein
VDHHERRLLETIAEEVRRIREDVERLLRHIALTEIEFIQVEGDDMPTNFTIAAGTSGHFVAVLTPPNGLMNGVPQWASSDPAVVLTPAANGLSCDAAVPATDTNPSFDLTLTAVSSDPTITVAPAVHTITIMQPVPPPTPLTAIDFAQAA